MFHADRMKTIYLGDCRQMTEIPDNFVHCVVSSPPYWGLRRYEGNQDLVWGDNHCQHEWIDEAKKVEGGHSGGKSTSGIMTMEAAIRRDIGTSGIVEVGFCSKCGAWRGALGLEPTPEIYLQHMIEILREVKRVLRPDGTVWVNISDSYSGGNRNTNPAKHGGLSCDAHTLTENAPNRLMGKHPVIKPLDLCLIPQRLAILCQQDGWWVRSIIIWNKANPMPESVNGVRWEKHRVKVKRGKRNEKVIGGVEHWNSGGQNLRETEWQDCPGCPKCSPTGGYVLRRGSWRPTESHEYILMLTKTDKYYADMEAVREPYTEPLNRWGGPEFRNSSHKYIDLGGHDGEQYYGATSMFREGRPVRAIETGRNLRSVWEFPTEPYPGAHFAVFPEKLPEICIKASTPEMGVCAKCGSPWARIIENNPMVIRRTDWGDNAGNRTASSGTMLRPNETRTIGWKATCSCNTIKPPVPATILDPFMGSGTTLFVAQKLGRKSIGYDLSEKYCALALDRLRQVGMELTG